MFAPGLHRAETTAEHIERLSMPIPEAGCYAWLGQHSRGYAKMHGGGRKHARVIRVLCEPIPAGLEVDHKCHQRWCVNPDHLQLLTHKENIQRIVRSETCPEGHSNWRQFPSANGRICWDCRMEYQRKYRNRRVSNGPE